jgi:hypothetical protein
MSGDHDTRMRTAQQLIATSLDDSEARMVRTRQLLAGSTALLQQSKSSRQHRLLAKPMLRNQESN